MKIVVGIMLMLFMASVLSMASTIAESPTLVHFERVSSGKLFYDDFNDGVADGWTVQLGNEWKVVDGEYFTHCPIGVESTATVDNLVLTDFIVEVKSRFSDPIGHLAVIVFRYTDNEHYYWFHISAEHDRIAFRYLPGEVYLGGVDYPIDRYVNYTLKVKVIGNSFTGFLNGEEIVSVTDSDYTYASGQVGLNARAADVFFDNFKVYKSDTILITNLRAGQKVELYDNADVLKASDTVGMGETQATLDVSALTFPFEGYFKIYAIDRVTLLHTTPPYGDIWGGDKYIVKPITAYYTNVGVWHFDEGSGNVAHDETSYENDGTIYGAKWVTGKINSGLYLDEGDYVKVPASPSLSLKPPFTVGAWIKVSEYPPVYDAWAILVKGTIGNENYGLYVNSNGTVGWQFTAHLPPELLGPGNPYVVLISKTYVVDGRWHHVVGEYDGNEMKLYVDGVLENVMKVTYIPDMNNYPLTIGIRLGTHLVYKFKGFIDEVSIKQGVSYDELWKAYNELKSDFDSLKSSYEALKADYTSLKSEYDSLKSAYDSLRSDYDKLRTDYNLLRTSHESLKANYESLQAKYTDLESKYQVIQVVTSELTYVRNLIYVFIATTIAFMATTVYFASRKPK